MLCQAGLELHARAGHDRGMAEPTIQTREERLAARLRENLRRRKAQARALGADAKPALPKDELKS